MRNRRMSRIVSSVIKRSAQPKRRRKREKKKQQVNKHSENTERAAHYLADFFAVIARLTLSCQT